MFCTPKGTVVSKVSKKQIKEIEDTQEALRRSIAESKELAEKAQDLLQKHKDTVKNEAS